MEQEEYLNYQKLFVTFQEAIELCDPIEWHRRQQKLLYELCNLVLKPYFDEKVNRIMAPHEDKENLCG